MKISRLFLLAGVAFLNLSGSSNNSQEKDVGYKYITQEVSVTIRDKKENGVFFHGIYNDFYINNNPELYKRFDRENRGILIYEEEYKGNSNLRTKFVDAWPK